MNKKSLWKLILILAIPCIIGFMPAPAGLSELAWVLFGIYLAAIVGLVIKPFPEPVVLLIAVAASMVVVGNLSDGAFKTTAVLSGYSSGTTWLVFSAFTLSAAFVTTGLGKKRYRSNVINWGMLPLQMAEVPTFEVGDYIYIPGIKAALDNPGTTFKGYVIHEDAPVTEITLYMESLTAEEREIIKAGSLINFNKNRQM